jgi:serine/threonine-protein kinase
MVALKTILPRYSSDPRYERLFLDEARLTAQVRHPNVAQILDLGEDNGMLFFAMEWIEGVSLSELLQAAAASRVQIPLSVAIRIATQAAAGLHAAHELRDADGELVGLVHRDVSPPNILVSFDGITKVIDFGIAKVMRDGGDDATRSFQVRGKVGYLAPEQIMDMTTDRRVDVFALGIVLYVLTAGVHPFEGRGPLATIYNITCQEPVTPPSTFRKDYPAELEAAVMKCLDRDKARRFASCDELVWALESSIPSDLRATDQDVAIFVRSLAGNLGVQRWRALELATAESGSFASWSPAPLSKARADKKVGPTVNQSEPPLPRRSRSDAGATPAVGSLVIWAAVFAASLFILVTQWHAPPAAEFPERTSAAAQHPPRACPATPSSTPAPPPVVRTHGLSQLRRLSNRSDDP